VDDLELHVFEYFNMQFFRCLISSIIITWFVNARSHL